MSGLDRDILSPGHGAPTSVHSASIDILDPAHLLPTGTLANLRLEAAAALTHIPRDGEVRVRLLDDAAMAEAHLKYSDIPGTTDVLTFDLTEGKTASGAPLDVDILVCIDEARRQAATHQHAPEREALLYILHGVLHCLGHDDHDDDAFERMHTEEDRILRAIGIGPLFNPGTPTLRGGPSGTPTLHGAPSGTPTLRGGSADCAHSTPSLAPTRNALPETVAALRDDVALSPIGFLARDPYPDGERGLSVNALISRRNLPHILMPGATYFVTWKCRPGESLSPGEQSIALRSLLHFHGTRCVVYAANVMSNHVHWIVRPLADATLDDLVTSVKRFSAIEINKQRGYKGHLWDPECFDHIIRDTACFRKFLAYVVNNPVEARVVGDASRYEWTHVHPDALGPGSSDTRPCSTKPATECRATRTESLP